MRLTKKAIKRIKSTQTRLRLALALGFSEQWIIKLIDQNKDNGPLTTIKAVQFIMSETSMGQEEIVEEIAISA
jgi:hypothetical protein